MQTTKPAHLDRLISLYFVFRQSIHNQAYTPKEAISSLDISDIEAAGIILKKNIPQKGPVLRVTFDSIFRHFYPDWWWCGDIYMYVKSEKPSEPGQIELYYASYI